MNVVYRTTIIVPNLFRENTHANDTYKQEC